VSNIIKGDLILMEEKKSINDVLSMIFSLLGILGSIIGLILSYQIPKFEKIFIDIDAKLPHITEIILKAPRSMALLLPITLGLCCILCLKSGSNETIRTFLSAGAMLAAWAFAAFIYLALAYPISEPL
jgi:type II secretory pathway component PulF